MPPQEFFVVEYEPKDIDFWSCLACVMLGVMLAVAWIGVAEGCVFFPPEVSP